MDCALGLDISTSIIGWTVLPLTATAASRPSDSEWGFIDLRSVRDGFWAKVDCSKLYIEQLMVHLQMQGYDIKHVFIEEPLKRFKRGMSSSHTIMLLAKFNCMVSYFVRARLGMDPEYIDASVARKALGIKLQSRKKTGLSQKEQVFRSLSASIFSGEVWPLNRNGNIQPYAYDKVDSYVISLSGILCMT